MNGTGVGDGVACGGIPAGGVGVGTVEGNGTGEGDGDGVALGKQPSGSLTGGVFGSGGVCVKPISSG